MNLTSARFYPSGAAFYTGVEASSSLVPFIYPVALGGRPYMIDFNQQFYRQYKRQLAPLIRTQADTSTNPGEHSLDPNGLWHRSDEDWVGGKDQRYYDRPSENTESGSTSFGSIPSGFWQSKGIDALTTKWQISLLNDTTQWRSSANTNLSAITVGVYVYITDGQHVYYASSLGGSFTAVASTPAVTVSSICTDGFNVWMAYGASGIYHTTAGASGAADQWVTSAIGSSAIVSYVNQRLMVADGAEIYNIILGTGQALPTALFTAGGGSSLPGNGVTFTNFAEGNGAIYVGATEGSKSWIYGMTVTTDGTSLGAPVIQGAVPDGESVTCVYGYLSLLFLGTTLGVRMCQTAASGSVTLGSLIETPSSVRCLTGWNRFVYYGLTQYDSLSSGLGRLDTQNQVINNDLPASCSDLMVTSQGAVTGVGVYQGSPVIAISGGGIYRPDPANLVPSGTIDSGYIMYDLTERKVASLLDFQLLSNVIGSASAYLSVDAGPFGAVGTWMAGNPVPITFALGPAAGQRFEVRIQLNRDGTNTDTGPTLTRWTLRSYPAPARPLTWQIPLILNENIEDRSFYQNGFDPLVELQALETMAQEGLPVDYQEGNNVYPVYVQDVEFLPDYTEMDYTNPFFNGIALVQLVGLPPNL